jgi:Domain of unknown function (DUF6434)/SAP domain-containing new25
MKRPSIFDIESGDELKRWYWLKEELITFCKTAKIRSNGSKFEILDRIATALDNCFPDVSNNRKKTKAASFNWAKEKLTLETIITENYTNGPNTRSFFKEYCGEKFHFSIPFMAYMKENTGKTLQDAIGFWMNLQDLRKVKNFKSEIPAGNQYNQYLRDFFADNPGKTITEARNFWKLKRSLPLGKHIYERTDLKLK